MVFVNDLPDIVDTCTVNLYADDTTIYYSNKDPKLVQSTINSDVESIVSWIEMNGLKMNVSKTQMMTLQRKSTKPAEAITVKIRGEEITHLNSIKYLGVVVDKDLNWKPHITEVRRKALAAIATIRRARPENFSTIHLCSLTWTIAQSFGTP